MRSKLLALTAIAAMSLAACKIGKDTTTGGNDAGTKEAACARVQTITAQLKDMQEQIRQAEIRDGPIGSAQERQGLERQKVPLKAELVVQNKVCKG